MARIVGPRARVLNFVLNAHCVPVYGQVALSSFSVSRFTTEVGMAYKVALALSDN
jgi:hypothetical protein